MTIVEASHLDRHDMTSIITKFKSEKVKAIALTDTPTRPPRPLEERGARPERADGRQQPDLRARPAGHPGGGGCVEQATIAASAVPTTPRWPE